MNSIKACVVMEDNTLSGKIKFIHQKLKEKPHFMFTLSYFLVVLFETIPMNEKTYPYPTPDH